MQTIVMKFGGASVASPDHFAKIANIIVERSRQFKKVVVVVSAMGQTTNHLIDLASKVNIDPPRREYDMLLTVGERISIALLAMAIAKKGGDAVSFTGSQSGIITCSNHSDAKIINVKPHRITRCLDDGKIAIVAGFQGVSEIGEITTLGRGGSDTTAVALACALGAEFAEFFKDVPGVFNEDPKSNPKAEIFNRLSYEEALKIVLKGAKILHPRSVELAQKNYLPLHVCSFLDGGQKVGTIIHESNLLQKNQPVYEIL